MHAQIVVTFLTSTVKGSSGFVRTCGVNAPSLADAITLAIAALSEDVIPSQRVVRIEADEIDPAEWPKDARKAFRSSPEQSGAYFVSGKAFWKDES